jgi:hypothetical protein
MRGVPSAERRFLNILPPTNTKWQPLSSNWQMAVGQIHGQFKKIKPVGGRFLTRKKCVKTMGKCQIKNTSCLLGLIAAGCG